ncbi:glutamine synthetase family protein [Spongiactinospora sp. TRM90649]|uniref:glutamine synthetase family protein n=1 Tax=Spongiactinospora sp. TRM90649 TaxID=3031114 RepID=UPI0023F63187|nr:glutamine synthetase family protein [Spongiactinospora sp. TRM90649]MDF5755995.1 glutamine synthetase family protein [Spongiactinospora sp. TRM90649]
MRDRESVTEIKPLDPAARRVLERSEIEGIELIRFLYADHGGVIRGKAASRARLAQRLGTGIGHTVAMMAMNMLDQLQPVEGMGPVGEVRLVPDPATFVPLPYAPGAAAMLCDLRLPDGSPWDACPRTFLREAIGELDRAGYTMLAAYEPEFTLGRRLPGDPFDRLVPIDDSLCYAAIGFDAAHDYTIRLIRSLETQGLRVEHYHPELGHGQQELSIRHAPAMRAADNQVLYRETVRSTALRMAMWASLAPKPIAAQAGNGAHLHLSLWDRETRDNLFADATDPNGLSELGYRFIAGVLAHLPALVALTCGSVNGFRRLAPRMWSSAYTCYGADNREAAVRICSPLAEGSANLELKPSDSSANPYLSLGAVIHAGLDGIRRGLDPGEAVNVDPDTLSPGERARLGVHRLPSTLDEALSALAADELLMDALGPLRGTAYLAVKRSEAAAFAAEDQAFELFHHLRVF